MITEETIKQTRFYVGSDGKCYLIRDMRTVKVVSLVCTSDGSESDLLLGDDVCSQFTPAQATFEPFIQTDSLNQVAAEKPAAAPKTKAGKKLRGKHKKRAAGAEEPKHIPGLRGPRKKSSKYKGVSPAKLRQDGTHQWRAQHWENGKLISIGQFKSEELAAAALAEHEGNHAEAARLRALAGRQNSDMAKQAENNPDRARKVTIWICNHCKTEWKSRPDRCPHCDGATFTPKKVDADQT